MVNQCFVRAVDAKQVAFEASGVADFGHAQRLFVGGLRCGGQPNMLREVPGRSRVASGHKREGGGHKREDSGQVRPKCARK